MVFPSFSRLLSRVAVLACSALAAGMASAQYTFENVLLHKQINLTQFSATSGNGCWGYVSPSGREYAIMGLNNKVAFVEITDPANATWVTTMSIPHTSSQWADIKVYQNYAYVCTEAAGTGIQVINLQFLDAGIVTLVRTISSPGRSHTLALDPVSGYLYTCGSRDGTGTTMCFSLANPSNPVRVGPNSMTVNYSHEAHVVTYTSGPAAGKQIFYAFSEGRGIEVWDFTNKAFPVLLKTITYPNIGYCHQGWMSEDRKYLYVDDEFDESNLQVPTRSLVFNVEDPANGYFVGTFSTGSSSIDHNQYVQDGFIFQANYRSGLRVFDLSETPETPVQTGWFDTYPTDDNRGYQGAWSNYPFFPSGTVIVSDINRGLFILNVDEATTRTVTPTDISMPGGAIAGGSLASLASSDDQRLDLVSLPSQDLLYPVSAIVSGFAYDNSPTKLRLRVESSGRSAGTTQEVQLYNWGTGLFETLDTRLITRSDSTITVAASGNVSRFVHPTTRRIDARIQFQSNGSDARTLRVSVDQVNFLVTR